MEMKYEIVYVNIIQMVCYSIVLSIYIIKMSTIKKAPKLEQIIH
jgi:hypothetical protein